MRKIRLLSLFMSLLICASLLAGCGGDKTDLGDAPGDGSAVVATSSGTELTVDEYRYFVLQNAVSIIQKVNPAFDGDFTKVDWNAATESGQTIAEAVKNQSLSDFADYAAMVKLGEEKGVKITEEELSGVMSSMEQYKEDYGEDGLKLALRAMGFSSVEGYKKLVTLLEGYQKVENDFNQNKEKYIEDEKLLQGYKSDEQVSTQHILIMNDSEKHANPEETIKEILTKAKAGEDFAKLMTEYNEDPGQTPAGYSFGKGVMVPEFEAASFALDYNEISEVIESDYGYHIIKRVVGLYELKESIRDEVEVNHEVLDSLSVADIMTDIYKANEKLSKQNGGK